MFYTKPNLFLKYHSTDNNEIKANGLKIEIRSYADCRGSKSYNINLSSSRGLAIKKYLMKNGVSKNQIVTKSLGATNFPNPKSP